MARVSLNGSYRGIGVFIETDLLLIPRHLIGPQFGRYVCGEDLQTLVSGLSIEYSSSSAKLCYLPVGVVSFEEDGGELDYCLLRLERPMPCQVPQITYSTHHDQLFFAEVQPDGLVKSAVVPACQLPTRDAPLGCALSPTKSGSSGGVYLDASGCLVGIHLGQSTGICMGETGAERTFLYAKDIVRSSPVLAWRPTIPFAEVKKPYCLTQVFPDVCSIPQADVVGTSKVNDYGYYCKAKEWHITNAQRGLQIELRKQHIDSRRKHQDDHVYRVHFQFYLTDAKWIARDPNIHSNRLRATSYDDNEEAFYTYARDLFLHMRCNQQDALDPVSFGFSFKGDNYWAHQAWFQPKEVTPILKIAPARKRRH